MAELKERVTLTREQETLLIPLYSKATESRRPNPILVDVKAQQILDRVEYDFARLKIPRKTAVTLSIRASKLDAIAREFLATRPEAVVLHLGCGLDSRCLRVEHPMADWYDLDFPDVIALRRKFYEESPTYHMLASSVTDLSWMDQVRAAGRPVLVIAEGLLMYLDEEEVKRLFLALRAAFPGCEVAADVFSVLTARRSGEINSLNKTGAVIRWGIDDPRASEGWAPGIRLEDEWYFTRADEVGRLELTYRLAFAAAGLFAAANRAHRIVRFVL